MAENEKLLPGRRGHDHGDPGGEPQPPQLPDGGELRRSGCLRRRACLGHAHGEDARSSRIPRAFCSTCPSVASRAAAASWRAREFNDGAASAYLARVQGRPQHELRPGRRRRQQLQLGPGHLRQRQGHRRDLQAVPAPRAVRRGVPAGRHQGRSHDRCPQDRHRACASAAVSAPTRARGGCRSSTRRPTSRRSASCATASPSALTRARPAR